MLGPVLVLFFSGYAARATIRPFCGLVFLDSMFLFLLFSQCSLSICFLLFSAFCLAASSLSFSFVLSRLSIFPFPLVLFVSFPLILLVFVHIHHLLIIITLAPVACFPVPALLNWNITGLST